MKSSANLAKELPVVLNGEPRQQLFSLADHVPKEIRIMDQGENAIDSFNMHSVEQQPKDSSILSYNDLLSLLRLVRHSHTIYYLATQTI